MRAPIRSSVFLFQRVARLPPNDGPPGFPLMSLSFEFQKSPGPQWPAPYSSVLLFRQQALPVLFSSLISASFQHFPIVLSSDSFLAALQINTEGVLFFPDSFFLLREQFRFPFFFYYRKA